MSKDIHMNNEHCIYKSELVHAQNEFRKRRSLEDFITVINQLMEKQGI
jgi:hypothetical protein